MLQRKQKICALSNFQKKKASFFFSPMSEGPQLSKTIHSIRESWLESRALGPPDDCLCIYSRVKMSEEQVGHELPKPEAYVNPGKERNAINT